MTDNAYSNTATIAQANTTNTKANTTNLQIDHNCNQCATDSTNVTISTATTYMSKDLNAATDVQTNSTNVTTRTKRVRNCNKQRTDNR